MTEEKKYLKELGGLLRRANELVSALEADELPPELSTESSREKNKKRIEEFLKDLGAPLKNKGYSYIVMAILEGLEDPLFFDRGITKHGYPRIAEEYKTTWSKVERGIRYEKELIFKKGNAKLQELFPYFKEGVPNVEFLKTIVEYLRKGE